MKLVAVTCGTILIAALLSGAAGYQLGHSELSRSDSMPDLFTTAQSRYDSYVFGIRKNRNNEAHEEDLRSYLAYLDARARDRDAVNANVYAFDKTLARVRLSQLAQSRGATGVAVRMTEEADAICPLTGLRNCSANNVLITARERDRRAWGIPANTGVE